MKISSANSRRELRNIQTFALYNISVHNGAYIKQKTQIRHAVELLMVRIGTKTISRNIPGIALTYIMF